MKVKKVDLNSKRSVLIEKFSIEKGKKVFLLSYLDGCKIEVYEHNKNITYYTKRGKILFYKDSTHKLFGVRWKPIWMMFLYKFGMHYTEVQEFILPLIEKHLELEGFKVNVIEPELSAPLEGSLKFNNQMRKVTKMAKNILKNQKRLLNNGNKLTYKKKGVSREILY